MIAPADRIEAGSATVAIVGLGYVGLPVAAAFLNAGHTVIGFDIDPEKIRALAAGESYLQHVPDENWQLFAGSDRFQGTTDARVFAEADAVLICVPTPLTETREPDLSYVEESARSIAKHVRSGALIILESTSYPGTTRAVLAPIFAASSAAMHFAYSPEREDPGRTDVDTVEVPKLVGGLDDRSAELAATLYRTAYQTVEVVRSAEVAEAAKILENVYRAVNIALVNEMKLILERMDLDIWEVIDAASSKPYGFQAFRPGPGLGGHCIPIDPFYLTWRAAQAGFPTRFIELAGEINTAMPQHVVDRVRETLRSDQKTVRDAEILVLGVAYKAGVGDTRETPAAEIIARLIDEGAAVHYHDPLVPQFPKMRRYSLELSSVPLTEEALRSADLTLVVTDQPAIDWDLVAEHAAVIVDTRNALAGRDVRGRWVKG